MSDCKKDHELGLQREITRRDFLNGFSIAVGGAMALPRSAWADAFGMPADEGQEAVAQNSPGYYPPARAGMRGSHDGSWEVAHAMCDGKKWPAAAADPERYDLVIVGAGISGLSAAYFYRQHAGDKAQRDKK
jgi:spermidine dehydrogenase